VPIKTLAVLVVCVGISVVQWNKIIIPWCVHAEDYLVCGVADVQLSEELLFDSNIYMAVMTLHLQSYAMLHGNDYITTISCLIPEVLVLHVVPMYLTYTCIEYSLPCDGILDLMNAFQLDIISDQNRTCLVEHQFSSKNLAIMVQT